MLWFDEKVYLTYLHSEAKNKKKQDTTVLKWFWSKIETVGCALVLKGYYIFQNSKRRNKDIYRFPSFSTLISWVFVLLFVHYKVEVLNKYLLVLLDNKHLVVHNCNNICKLFWKLYLTSK